jgi:antirestriction protein ArdC
MPQIDARAAAHASGAKDRSGLYDEITNKIVAELEAGRLPWVQPWGSSHVRALLTDQDRAIVRAASAASKAADYLLAFRDRQAGAAGEENRDGRLPGADGRMCRRRLRPCNPSRNPESEEERGAS